MWHDPGKPSGLQTYRTGRHQGLPEGTLGYIAQYGEWYSLAWPYTPTTDLSGPLQTAGVSLHT